MGWGRALRCADHHLSEVDSTFLEAELFKSGLDQGWLDAAEEYAESPRGGARREGRRGCPNIKKVLLVPCDNSQHFLST